MTAFADGRFNQRLGQNLRLIRTRRGLTQEQLASAIGLSRASIANIEQGRQQVLLQHAWAMARALGAALDDLVAAPDAAPEQRKSLPEGFDPELREWAMSIVGPGHP